MSTINSTVRTAKVNTKVAVMPYGNVGADHDLVRELLRRAEKAGCEGILVRPGDRVECGLCVVTSRITEDLIDTLKPLHRRHTVRVYTTFDINKLKDMYRRLGAGEWVRRKDHFLWVPADYRTWVLPFSGKCKVSRTRARKLNLLDRVLEQKDWWVLVDLKGLHLDELPAEWIQWMCSERLEKLDDQVREAFEYASRQPWYKDAITQLLQEKGDEGFSVEDVKPQTGHNMFNPEAERYEMWENYGVKKAPRWLPVTRAERNAIRDEWLVSKSAYEKVGEELQVRLLFEDEGKVDDDRVGLWLWSWRYTFKVLERMERVQTLSDLQDLLELFMSEKSLNFIAYDEEGGLHIEKGRYVLWVRTPQKGFTDPNNGEEYYEADEAVVEMILDTYRKNCDRINHKEEVASEREDSQWILTDDGNGEMEYGLRIRRKGGTVRRVDRHPLQSEVVDVKQWHRRTLRDLDRAHQARWNTPVCKIDESEVLGAVAEAIRFAEAQK